MPRKSFSLPFESSDGFKKSVLIWADKNYSTVCFFDNNHYADYSEQQYEGLFAFGIKEKISFNAGNAFHALKTFYTAKNDWLFGYFGYDLKNETEALDSKNHDGLDLPDLFFFQPEIVVEIFEKKAVFHFFESDININQLLISISESVGQLSDFNTSKSVKLIPRISKSEYIQTVNKIHQHIARGDVYEMNFCQEFFSENHLIEPLSVFQRLNEISKAPFTCYFKNDVHYLLSASPERFLQKKGDKLTSMPIKGTARRGATPEEDKNIRESLFRNQKERSENVMIVDLVRNDLSRSCWAGTVQTEELFGVKTFEQVHQLVSTVSGMLHPEVHFVDAIKNAFPMGSMTGAPKVRAMQLIEQYEKSKRGLYSGAIGYLTPSGDFDFNVVIRSLIYNRQRLYLSLHVGSAIVFDSVPEKEYEECLLKAKALMNVLSRVNHSLT